MDQSKGHLLLADDDASFAATMAELLHDQGYEVTVAKDAYDALAVAEHQQFELLLADLEMPGNDDLALVRGVSARHGNLPIIIITGFPSIRTTLACIELPVVAYLLKPVSPPVLIERINQAVGRYRAYRRADERLEQWRRDLAEVTTPSAGTGPEAFMRLALRNVMGSLSDVGELAGRTLGTVAAPSPHTCQVLNCPRGAQFMAALQETVFVLEQTRSAFKSTQLRDLRRKLVLMLEHQ